MKECMSQAASSWQRKKENLWGRRVSQESTVETAGDTWEISSAQQGLSQEHCCGCWCLKTESIVPALSCLPVVLFSWDHVPVLLACLHFSLSAAQTLLSPFLQLGLLLSIHMLGFPIRSLSRQHKALSKELSRAWF